MRCPFWILQQANCLCVYVKEIIHPFRSFIFIVFPGLVQVLKRLLILLIFAIFTIKELFQQVHCILITEKVVNVIEL